ncbi:LysE family translocator [Jiangella asiatica]|uniref:LysE family translocator n=2 Tax=Jiangella asiatica TaxID=2530372 RepID=A0A4R5DNJ6_9ACTN|nr:LysE family translocator [Jiangella asiatica]
MWGFGLALLPIVLTPGASLALVAAREAAGDRRGAAWVVGGTALGIVTHAVLAGVGLSAVVMRSAEAYTVVRLAGAAYLVALGVHLLRRATRKAAGITDPTVPASSSAERSRRDLPTTGHVLTGAYLANVLNPKAAAVYLTLAPQFVPERSVGVASMLGLGLVHIILMAGWLAVWVWSIARARRAVPVSRLSRWMDTVGGLALAVLGVKLLLSRPST